MPLELADERRRLCALARYEIVDTPPEEVFDRIARLAASLFRAPVALISFVAEDRLFFKAEVGLHTRYAPRAASFCDHAIGGRGPCLISDAAQHPSFADHPFVVGVPGIRFYAGAMLRTKDGYNLGTLCVIDTMPRPDVTAEDQRHLEDLAAIVMEHLELRAKTAVARALDDLSREKPGRSARPSRAAGSDANSRDQVLAEGHRLITEAYRDSHLMAHRGQDLVRAGEPCERVLRVYTGWACRYRLLANGTRQILDILLPGNLIGIDGLFSEETPSAVMALTDVTYGSVPCSDLWSLLQQPAAGIQMALAVMEQQLRSDHRAISMGRGSAEQRLAAFLLTLFDRLNRRKLTQQQAFTFPLTQRDVGDHLGINVVHLNRTLRRLRDAGIVRIAENTAVIRDMDALRSLAALEHGVPR